MTDALNVRGSVGPEKLLGPWPSVSLDGHWVPFMSNWEKMLAVKSDRRALCGAGQDVPGRSQVQRAGTGEVVAGAMRPDLALGTTAVTCTARDRAGNRTSATFQVNVTAPSAR